MSRLTIAFAAAMIAAASAACAQPGVLLVTAKQARVLSMVDASSLKVVAQVPVGEDPHEVVIAPDRRSAYVSDYGEGTLNSITVVDLSTRRQLKTIDVGPLKGPHGLVFSQGRLWFTAVASKAVASLDPQTSRLLSVVGTGQDNSHMLWVPADGERIVVSNPGSGTLSIFDPVLRTPKPPPGAPTPPASYTYRDWTQALVPVGVGSEGFDVTGDGRHAWIGNAEGVVSIVDLEGKKTVASIQLPGVGVNRLRFTPDGRLALITTRSGKDLIIVDVPSRKVMKQVPIQQRGASGIVVEPNGKRAFIACPRDHYVAVIDLARLEIVGKIDVGREPDGLAWWEGAGARAGAH